MGIGEVRRCREDSNKSVRVGDVLMADVPGKSWLQLKLKFGSRDANTLPESGRSNNAEAYDIRGHEKSTPPHFAYAATSKKSLKLTQGESKPSRARCIFF